MREETKGKEGGRERDKDKKTWIREERKREEKRKRKKGIRHQGVVEQ